MAPIGHILTASVSSRWEPVGQEHGVQGTYCHMSRFGLEGPVAQYAHLYGTPSGVNAASASAALGAMLDLHTLDFIVLPVALRRARTMYLGIYDGRILVRMPARISTLRRHVDYAHYLGYRHVVLNADQLRCTFCEGDKDEDGVVESKDKSEDGGDDRGGGNEDVGKDEGEVKHEDKDRDLEDDYSDHDKNSAHDDGDAFLLACASLLASIFAEKSGLQVSYMPNMRL